MPSAASRAELRGGSLAAALGLAEAMALGALCLSPLGPGYVSLGVMAGLYGLCLINLGSALGPDRAAIVSGPYSLSSILMASALAALLQGPAHGDVGFALGLLVLISVLAALLQLGFALARLGDLARYIPQPVVGGLLNGAALTILAAQVGPMLGIDRALTPGSPVPTLAPGAALTSAVTLLSALAASKLSRRWPAPLVGLAVGTAFHHGLARAAPGLPVGPIVGAFEPGLPLATFLPNLRPLVEGAHPEVWRAVLPFAGALALVLTLRSLIVTVALEQRSGQRAHRTLVLQNQASGNLLAASLGGLVGTASLSASLISHRYGGRGRAARLAAAAFVLAAVALLGPVVAQVPRAVLAATLAMISFQAFDTFSLGALLRMLRGDAQARAMGADLLLMLTVTGVLIGVGTLQAVGVGVAISVALLLHRLGKDCVRRRLRGGEIFSHVHRDDAELQVLIDEGRRIHVIELEGALFFGTADRLLEEADHFLELSGEILVLDFRRVTNIDHSGAVAVLRTQQRLATAGTQLWLCGAHGRRSLSTQLTSVGMAEEGQVRHFRSLDQALAAAEDHVLDGTLGQTRYDEARGLDTVDAVAGLSPDAREVLAGYLDTREHGDGAIVCRQGDAGDSAHFILRGRAQILLEDPEVDDPVTIGILCPGTMFGAMSLLDGNPRSATVRAEGALSSAVLTREAFDALQRAHPEVALSLLEGMARELSRRIRIGNRISAALRG